MDASRRTGRARGRNSHKQSHLGIVYLRTADVDWSLEALFRFLPS